MTQKRGVGESKKAQGLSGVTALGKWERMGSPLPGRGWRQASSTAARGRQCMNTDAGGRVDALLSLGKFSPYCPNFLGEVGSKSLS